MLYFDLPTFLQIILIEQYILKVWVLNSTRTTDNYFISQIFITVICWNHHFITKLALLFTLFLAKTNSN